MFKPDLTIQFLKHLKRLGVGIEHDITEFAFKKISDEYELMKFIFDMKNNGYISFTRHNWGDFGWDSSHSPLLIKATLISGGEKRIEEYRTNSYTRKGVIVAIIFGLITVIGYSIKDMLPVRKLHIIKQLSPINKKPVMKILINQADIKDTIRKK